MVAKNNIIRWKSTLWKCNVIISHFLIQNNSILLDHVFSFLTLTVKKHWTSSTILNTILLLGNSLLAKNFVWKMKSSEFWDKTDNYNVDLICRIFEQQQYTLKFWGSWSTQDTLSTLLSLLSASRCLQPGPLITAVTNNTS